ncbi:hypothetical protein ISCGN_012769 [Ixodes scapularis]
MGREIPLYCLQAHFFSKHGSRQPRQNGLEQIRKNLCPAGSVLDRLPKMDSGLRAGGGQGDSGSVWTGLFAIGMFTPLGREECLLHGGHGSRATKLSSVPCFAGKMSICAKFFLG